MSTRDNGSGSIGAPAPVEDGFPVVIRMSDVRPQAVTWLWPGRAAIGKLTLIVGDPGLGKSILTVDMAARVSTGAGWPDRPDDTGQAGGVVLLNAEDDPADTIRPRLDAAGADCGRIIMVPAVFTVDPQSKRVRQKTLSLADNLPALERAIDAVSGCRLVVIDPISSYLGETDSHANSDVRGLLHPLADLAAAKGVAMVAVSHLNKSAGTRAIHRTTGSVAFVAAARAVWLVTIDKADAARRLLLPVKNNLAIDGGGLAFRLAAGDVPWLEWEPGAVTIRADEALSDDGNGSGRSKPQDRAAEFLQRALANGPRPSADVLAEGMQLDFSEKTLRRAFGRIGGHAKKTGFEGGWVWHLPDADGSTGDEDGQDGPSP